jgi:hypothetical protein
MAQEHLGNPLGEDPKALGFITDALIGGVLGAIDAKNDSQFVSQFLRVQRDAFDKEMLLDQRGLDASMMGADTFDLQLEDEGSALRYADPQNGAIYGQIDTWYRDSRAKAKTPQSKAAIDHRHQQLLRRAQGAHSQAQRNSFDRAGREGDFSWATPDNEDAKRVILEHASNGRNKKLWADISSEAALFLPAGKAVTDGGQTSYMRDPYPLMESHPEVYDLIGLAQNLGQTELTALPPEVQADVLSKLTKLQPSELTRATGAADEAMNSRAFDATMESIGVPEAKGMFDVGAAKAIPTKGGGTVYQFAPEAMDSLVKKLPRDPSDMLDKVQTLEGHMAPGSVNQFRRAAAQRVGGPTEFASAEQDQIQGSIPSLMSDHARYMDIASDPKTIAALQQQDISVLDTFPLWMRDPIKDFQANPELRRASAPDQIREWAEQKYNLPRAQSIYLSHLLSGDPSAPFTTVATLTRESFTSDAKASSLEDQLAYYELQQLSDDNPVVQGLQARYAEVKSLDGVSDLEATILDQHAGDVLRLVQGPATEEALLLTFGAQAIYEHDEQGAILLTGEEDEAKPTLSAQGRAIGQILSNEFRSPGQRLHDLSLLMVSSSPQHAEMYDQMRLTAGAALSSQILPGSIGTLEATEQQISDVEATKKARIAESAQFLGRGGI